MVALTLQVWFCANPATKHSGAFQDLSVHSADEVGLIPSHMSYDAAATLGSGLITAAVVLLKNLGLSLTDLEHGVSKSTSTHDPHGPQGDWLLVWGGAGATGVFLIQLARRLGYRVICAASPVNHAYLSRLGAEVVLDRWDTTDNLLDAVRAITGDTVRLAIDNVGSRTAGLCAQVLSGSRAWRRDNGSRGSLAVSTSSTGSPNDDSPSPVDVRNDTATLVAIAGSAPAEALEPNGDHARLVATPRVSFSTTYFGHPDFSRPLLRVLGQLLDEGVVEPTRLTVLEGGIYGIKEGLDLLRDRSGVGGHKLVLRL